MPCQFTTKEGGTAEVDLDAVIDVFGGVSGRRPDWKALLIYDPKSNVLIELRDSPQDSAYGTPDEAEEVDDAYVQKQFGLSEVQLADLRRHPKRWSFIDKRKSGG